MAILLNEQYSPEAVLLDDRQGRFLRQVSFYGSPLVYAKNLHELVHHAIKILHYNPLRSWTKPDNMRPTTLLQTVGAIWFSHNVIELSEHGAHIVKPAYQWLSGENNQTNTFEPDTMLGTLDLFCLLCTAGELFWEWHAGPLALADNSLSLLTGLANLLESLNLQSVIESNSGRLDEMVARYYSIYRDLYLQNHSKL